MKYHSENLVKDILGSRELNQLHTVRYASTQQLKQYLNDGLALRRQAFKQVAISAVQFIKAKIASIKQASQIKKNISELESISDDILKDIGIRREDIRSLVLKMSKSSTHLEEKESDSIVHFANFNTKQTHEAVSNIELKKCC